MSEQGPSTSFSSSQWKYDVFLSFRGDDTRKGFTDHLYTSLEKQGIRTFKDDQELRKGKAISADLLTAIEDSRFALIVLSPNYASSTWCLDELSKILECMEARGAVLPIFYDVNPSDVRKQTGTFAEAFTIHEERFKYAGIEKVQRWRSALAKVANLSGWNSRDWYEAALIKDVAEVIWTKLRPTLMFSSTKNLVGIDARVKEVESLLHVGGGDVRFIGIWGMGGIGKTTLARVVYERLSPEFECSIFLSSVRRVAQNNGLLKLQKMLLSKLWSKCDDLLDVHEGAAMIRRFLCHKRFLLVLDDVSNLHELEYLAGAQDWFGFGSRIIITTTDMRLLIQHGVERTFQVEKLNDDEALQLLSWHAFKKPIPEENYVAVCNSVLKYAGGLPLALEVIGSSLRARSPGEWSHFLGKLWKTGHPEVAEVLKLSYDNLDDEDKSIFLHIACFFIGLNYDYVVEVLKACGYAPIGISNLVEKSLITISSGKIEMHDLLEEMGKDVVRQECPNEPGKRTRLWNPEDVNHVLSQNTGTDAVQGIVLNSLHPTTVYHPDTFVKMRNLRLLKINSHVYLPNGLNSLPNSLRYLKWSGCSLESLPSSFYPENLVQIDMCRSTLEHLWSGYKPAHHLKNIKLSHCASLIKTPDFRGMPSLERLHLEGCTQLYEVDQSLGTLERLTLLNLKDCKSLVRLPGSVYGVKSLEILNLSGCSKLDKLPDDLGDAESLEELDASGTAIRVVPDSIGRLKRLTSMSFKNCKNLVHLPSSVGGLTSLRVLNLSGCSKLDKLPNELGFVDSLEELDVSGTAIREPPSSIGLLRNLKVLSFHGCREGSSKWWLTSFLFSAVLKKSSDPIPLSLPTLSGLHSLRKLDISDCDLEKEVILNDISCLTLLEILNLSRNNFVTLPEIICKLPKLRLLRVEYCQKLQKLPELPCGLEVWADNCMSLETLSHSMQPRNLRQWQKSSVYCINCLKLVEKQGCKNLALTLLRGYLQDVPRGGNRFDFVIPGNEIPVCFKHQSLGSSVTVELEPGWSTDELMGYAVCAVFAVHEHQISLKSDICCQLEVDGKMLFPAPVFLGMPCHMDPAMSDHLWLFYIPRRQKHTVTEWQDFNNQLELSFLIDGPGLEVKKCGIFMIYKSRGKKVALSRL